jgi:hypothetical protein
MFCKGCVAVSQLYPSLFSTLQGRGNFGASPTPQSKEFARPKLQLNFWKNFGLARAAFIRSVSSKIQLNFSRE